MFGSRKYVLVGALVNATSSVEGDGGYRFIYPYQELPLALLRGETINEPLPYDIIPEREKPVSQPK